MLCPYAKKCSGCQLQNMEYEEQLSFKQAKAVKLLGRFAHVEPIIAMEDPLHYRNKVQTAFGFYRGRILAGVYQSADGRIVPAEECLLEDKGAGNICKTIKKLCEQYKIKVYDHRSGKGFLRHVMVRKSDKTGDYMVVFVTTKGIFADKTLFLDALLEQHPEISTIVHNINDTDKGLMLGEKSQILYGDGYITENLCGLDFRISAKSFFQVNRTQTEKLYNKVFEFANLSGKEVVLDAYCGTGTIGLVLAKKAKSVVGVEIVTDAVKDAEVNKKLNGITNADFINKDAGKFMDEMSAKGEKIDVVITDPPRAGCSGKFLKSLIALAPKKVVYVSCNPETLARDLYTLRSGGYKVKKIQPVDMFPFTSHLECVVCLSREKYARGDETMLCDMHTHSNCSDGSFSPEELIEEAKKEGIAAISLCDHNTVSGLTRFINAAKESGVIAVPGVEITSAYKGKEVHILGLFLKEQNYQKIANYLEQINVQKIESNKLLAKRLNEGGYVISYDDVLKIAGKAIPNRVHFAKALFAKGYVSSIAEAFDTILAEGGEFYKPAKKLDSLEVIRFLHAVDAVTVLAHPFLNFSKTELCEFLQKAKQYGLVGMETIYPLFSKEDSALAQEIAKEFALIASGGTDFHGINKPDIKLGRGKHNIFVPYEVYENLRRASRFPPK